MISKIDPKLKVPLSKSRIDAAGRYVASQAEMETDADLEKELIFDEFRKAHLEPLSLTTHDIQQYLSEIGKNYYISQRLKRKPQIIKKLSRLSTRLTQLQDIGGLRIIVEDNREVEVLERFIDEIVEQNSDIRMIRTTDYRERGRDITGYRSIHKIIFRNGVFIEIQIRSKIQHYWSESIERTSVVYGHSLKEGEGDRIVISYFQKLSDAFYEIESGREISSSSKIELKRCQESALHLIKAADRFDVLSVNSNDNVIRAIEDKEVSNPGRLRNWIIVFSWSEASFVTWEDVPRDADVAVRAYQRYEREFPSSGGYEVVLIGSSDIATVRETHSHYFGISDDDRIVERLDQAVIGFSKGMDLDVGARQILSVLARKKYWGGKSISKETLKNHYCKNVLTFDTSFEALTRKGLVINAARINGVSLDLKRRSDILSAI